MDDRQSGPEKVTGCRLCGGALKPAFVVGDRNRELGDGLFHYFRCRVCAATVLPCVPPDLDRYYESDGYGSVSDEELPHVVRGEEAKLEMVARLVPAGRLIEIGPGPGRFTRAARRAGYEVIAIEMDAAYCRALERQLGVQAIQSDDPAAVVQGLSPADAIVMWHAIEHLPDPWAVVERCVENLRPEGALAISTPNPASLQYRLLGRRWAHLDAPRHLQLIPLPTLHSRLERLGMRHVSTTTTDPVGLECNHLGWEFVVRRHPARRPSTPRTMAISGRITAAMSPIERRGLAGATYSTVFRRLTTDPGRTAPDER